MSDGNILSVKSITYSKLSAATVGMEMSGTTLSESTAKVSTWVLPSKSGPVISNFSEMKVFGTMQSGTSAIVSEKQE